MQTFIQRIAQELLDGPQPLHETLVLLPNQRAELFLREALKPHMQEPTLLPLFSTVDSFIANAAQLLVVEPLVLMLELYKCYGTVRLEAFPDREPESLGSFLSWGQTLLSDFGEIDRYLLDPENVLGDLYNVQKLAEWDLSIEEQTALMQRYSDFIALLPDTYNLFTSSLIEKGESYSGLAARKLAETPSLVDLFLKRNGIKHVVVAGLNALNTAELTIISELRKVATSKVLWDVDAHYMEMPEHEAGLFFRQHQSRQKVFGSDTPSSKGLKSSLKHVTKVIQPIGASQYSGQAKAIAHTLERWRDIGVAPQDIAVILTDETLLNPVLSFLPEGYDKVNITMGYPLDQTPVAATLRLWMTVVEYALKNKKNSNRWTFYHRSLSALLTDPLFNKYWNTDNQTTSNPQDWNRDIVKANRVFTNDKEWTAKLSEGPLAYHQILVPREGLDLLEPMKIWLKHVAEKESTDVMIINTAYKLHTLLEQLQRTLGDTLPEELALFKLLKQQLRAGTIDFVGEPLEGLQVMGILESRTLDFPYVILAGVNEGILPAGRNFNSLLPYDLKQQYGLPTYEQKDAVYAYHFYRILQRCDEAVITYNTDKDAMGGGEASRYIIQLEHELNGTNCLVKDRVFHNGPLHPHSIEERFSAARTSEVKEAIKDWMSRGMSASSLNELAERPHLFYQRRLIRIKEEEAVEESMSALMMGNLVHKGLEELYKPYVGKPLPKIDVEEWTERALEIGLLYLVTKGYSKSALVQGRNLVTTEVCRKMLHQFFSYDALRAKSGHVILKGIETKLDFEMQHPTLQLPLKFSGYVDRIEIDHGTLTIWDYKTGSIKKDDLSISSYSQLWAGSKPKAMQVLLYAWLLYKTGSFNTPLPWRSGMFKLQSSAPEQLLRGSLLNNKNDITEVMLLEFESELMSFLEYQLLTEDPFLEPAKLEYFR